MLMNHDFMSMQLHTSNCIPSFQDWLDQQDMTSIYASHRRQLQHLQHRCPVKRGWVLESPQHLWSLDTLRASSTCISAISSRTRSKRCGGLTPTSGWSSAPRPNGA
jgi:hypothetical protein